MILKLKNIFFISKSAFQSRELLEVICTKKKKKKDKLRKSAVSSPVTTLVFPKISPGGH